MTATSRPFIIQQEGALLSNSRLLELARAVTERGAKFRFYATGGSMAPLIRDGDILTIQPLDGAPGLGDVVAFLCSGHERMAVHRIIGSRKDAYLVRGDAAGQSDGWVPRSRLLGKIIHIRRGEQRIRFGLGPERRAIALLSRLNLMNTFLAPARLAVRWGRKS